MIDDKLFAGGVGARPGAAEGRATPIPPLPRVDGDRADPAGAAQLLPPQRLAVPAGHVSEEADVLASAMIDHLRAALAFYADLANWGSGACERRHDTVAIHTHNIHIHASAGYRIGPALDLGRTAREALATVGLADDSDPDPASAGALCLGG